MRAAFALRIFRGKIILFCKRGKSADFPRLLFHGRALPEMAFLQITVKSSAHIENYIYSRFF